MAVERIGIVGAGQMGNGIAHVCALAGYEVMLTDISQDALDDSKPVRMLLLNWAKPAPHQRIFPALLSTAS